MNTTPALLEHCKSVYNEMLDRAELREVDGVECTIYEGFLTKLFDDLSLSVPYYTSVMRELRRMDCVRQVRRGGGSSPSQWLMVQAPSADLFIAAQKRGSIHRAVPKNEQLAQQIADLHERVTRLEEATSA